MDSELTKSAITPDLAKKIKNVLESFFSMDHTDLDFSRFATARLEKQYLFLAEALDQIINYKLRPTEDILSEYYKLSEDESGSKTIEISADVKNIISKTSDCIVKRRLLLLNRIKSSYVSKQNINFIDLSYTDKSGNLLFAGVTYQSAKKTINLVKLLELRLRGGNNYYEKLLPEFKEADISIIDARWLISICEAASYRRCCEIRRGESGTILANNSYSKLISSEQFLNKSSELELMKAIMIDRTSISPSKAINSILNYNQKILLELNYNSTPIQYKYTNPISGFVSIKTKRVLSNSAKITEGELEQIVAKSLENNKFFETLVSEIKLEQLRFIKKNETDIKLVSGPEIVSYYNISSYFNNKYRYEEVKSSFFDFGSSPTGGPLFNSCMRGPACKSKIKFYSENDHIVKLLVLTTGNGKLLKARAVVWYDEDNDINYVDRIFYSDEKSLLSLVSYINRTNNTFSIYSGNSVNLLEEKKKSYFLIKFKGLKYISDTPYFDSVSHQLYIKNNEFYFGKHSAETLYSNTEQIKDKVYCSPLSFSKSTSVPNIGSKIPLINMRCSRCSSYIVENKGVIINGGHYCSRHFFFTDNNIPLINRSGQYLSPEKNDNIFVTKVVSHKDGAAYNFFKKENTGELQFKGEKEIKVCASGITSLNNISNTFASQYSSVFKTVMLEAAQDEQPDVTNKISKFIYGASSRINKFKISDNEQNEPISRNNNFLYLNYDKSTVKALELSSMKNFILIPDKLNQNDADQIKEVTRLSMLAYSRDNKIKINNIEYILKLNLNMHSISEIEVDRARKDLESLKTTIYLSFGYMGMLSKANVNGVDKLIIHSRTSNFNLYIPIDCIESGESKINRAIEELGELLKKEVSNG